MCVLRVSRDLRVESKGAASDPSCNVEFCTAALLRMLGYVRFSCHAVMFQCVKTFLLICLFVVVHVFLGCSVYEIELCLRRGPLVW